MGNLNEGTMRLLQAPVGFRAGIHLVGHFFICWRQSFVVWCERGQTVFT